MGDGEWIEEEVLLIKVVGGSEEEKRGRNK